MASQAQGVDLYLDNDVRSILQKGRYKACGPLQLIKTQIPKLEVSTMKDT